METRAVGPVRPKGVYGHVLSMYRVFRIGRQLYSLNGPGNGLVVGETELLENSMDC